MAGSFRENEIVNGLRHKHSLFYPLHVCGVSWRGNIIRSSGACGGKAYEISDWRQPHNGGGCVSSGRQPELFAFRTMFRRQSWSGGHLRAPPRWPLWDSAVPHVAPVGGVVDEHLVERRSGGVRVRWLGLVSPTGDNHGR